MRNEVENESVADSNTGLTHSIIWRKQTGKLSIKNYKRMKKKMIKDKKHKTKIIAGKVLHLYKEQNEG